jgi:hypothetical protein
MRLSGGRQISGFVMFVIGILALMFSAERGTTLAFDDVMAVRTGLAGPSSLQWIFLALVSVLAVSPSAIVIFWILKFTGQPLSA